MQLHGVDDCLELGIEITIRPTRSPSVLLAKSEISGGKRLDLVFWLARSPMRWVKAWIFTLPIW
jgi:hypothetical protein